MAVYTSDSYDGRYLQLSISESADAVSRVNPKFCVNTETWCK